MDVLEDWQAAEEGFLDLFEEEEEEPDPNFEAMLPPDKDPGEASQQQEPALELLSLPAEMANLVTSFLSWEQLRNLRLACKALCHAGR